MDCQGKWTVLRPFSIFNSSSILFDIPDKDMTQATLPFQGGEPVSPHQDLHQTCCQRAEVHSRTPRTHPVKEGSNIYSPV